MILNSAILKFISYEKWLNYKLRRRDDRSDISAGLVFLLAIVVPLVDLDPVEPDPLRYLLSLLSIPVWIPLILGLQQPKLLPRQTLTPLYFPCAALALVFLLH